MTRLCPLCSGSSGNSIYIGFSDCEAILVDVGRTTRQIENLLSENDINIETIKAIFVTHEHSDHVSGLRVFAKKYGLKIYGSEGTINSLRQKGIIVENNSYEVIDLRGKDLEFADVSPFYTSHDCSQGMGYVITAKDGASVAVCTDLGYVSGEIKQALSGVRSVVIESNHDVMMLENGPYPYYLKRRILSDLGHLSNDTCSEMLPYLVEKGTKNIVLAHLSEHNNIPELARQTALYNLEKNAMKEERDFRLFLAPKINTNTVNLTF